MPLARLCRTPRILGRVRSLLLGLLLDTAALLLRTLGRVPLSLRPHVALCRPWVAAQDCSVTGGWQRCRGRPLPLFDDLQPLCRFFLALSVVEFDLLHPQPRLGITHPCANAAQAVFHSEALVTGRLVLLPLDPKSLTLAPDAFMLRRTLLRSGGSCSGGSCSGGSCSGGWRLVWLLAGGGGLRKSRRGHEPRTEGCRCADEEGLGGHVSPVSTVRRSSARNSWDCISLSREIVRGNSCASGPSV